jgi:signal transduction histidine kinase
MDRTGDNANFPKQGIYHRNRSGSGGTVEFRAMLNRVRRLNISLAAKCQLLFGSALVLIIAAALFVPWQRMEQLTDQLNDVAAAAVADSAVELHVATATAPTTAPTTLPIAGNENPAQRRIRFNGKNSYAPRLIGLHPDPDEPITPWDRNVLAQLAKQPETPYFSRKYERRDGTEGYRYAEVLVLQRECVRCHTAPESQAIDVASTHKIPAQPIPTTMPATKPATAAAAESTHRPAVLGIVSVDIPSQIHTNQLLLNRVFLLTAGLLAGTLAIIVFYLIVTRLILQPVRVLQETAEKVSEGDLNIRSDINTGDEFQQLSDTFNIMLANLKLNADQLRAINKSLDLKIGQLAESNVALYESNRLKSEFLANVSHELRTPLNSILGFAELLKDASAAEPKSARYLQNILQSGKNLLDLINDLLDLAKIEAGRMEVRSEPLSVSDMFEGLGSLLKPLTESKSLTIKSEVASDVPILHTDPAKLQQVLYNFLSNAIKFSSPHATIELSADCEAGDQVRISVTDHGPGIETEKQGLIFEKFRQIDGSVTRQHSGTGLGLAISKELTALLGGSIGVRSTPGQGATFWVLLPQKIQPSIHDVRGKLVLS